MYDEDLGPVPLCQGPETYHFWRNISAGCGVTYEASEGDGTFSSPNYPDDYPNDLGSCVTKILGNPGDIIQLTFDEFFLEDSDLGACYDLIEVRAAFKCLVSLIDIIAHEA